MNRQPYAGPEPLIILPETDSTNTEARRRVMAGERLPFFLLAHAQTEGRGRMGRSFYSPKDTGIYLTYAFEPRDRGADGLWLTTAAAVAVWQAIRQTTGIECSIKWVNDLYARGRKVCGILAESCFVGERQVVILGVGVNLSTAEFPPELATVAGSLTPEEDGCKEALIGAICQGLHDLNQAPDRSRLMALYRANSMVLGQWVTYTENQVSREGLAESVDELGRLTVCHADRSRHVLCGGEITLRVNKENRHE